jgi:hypothetical protein
MSRYKRVSILASAGADTDWIPLNRLVTPFSVGFGVAASGAGTCTVRVEHTFEDVLRGATPTKVFEHSVVSAAALDSTTVIDGSYNYPVGAVRLHVTAVSASSRAIFDVSQAGDYH